MTAADPPRLPVGTQVVLRVAATDLAGATVQRGSIGRVTGPDGAPGCYRVRLPDGRELSLGRHEMSLRSRRQHEVATPPATGPDDGHALVTEHTVYAAVVGSRAYGLDTADSDTDVRGVYVAPTASFWSLRKPPTHVDGPEHEWFSWEVERFCELALKANPNLLEVLYSTTVVTMTPLGAELLELRPAFLSQLAHQTYSGYVLSQFRKIEADLRQRGAPRWKHVMHLLRLLLAARDLLADGRFVVDVGDQRDRLLAVRQGALSWDEVERWRLALHGELDAALARTPLPAAPDVDRVDGWLRSVRARSAGEALAPARESS